MNQRYDFIGQYKRAGNGYVSDDGIKLIYSERKDPAPTKPKSFLLLKEPEKPKKSYFSSLFPRSESTYKADHKGIDYVVSITSDCLTIKRKA